MAYSKGPGRALRAWFCIAVLGVAMGLGGCAAMYVDGTVLLSRWLVQTGRDDVAALALDLGPLAKRMEAHEMSCVANAAQIVARLHARGKPNEQQARGLRPPESGDDEFALESVGLAIRDLGWAA